MNTHEDTLAALIDQVRRTEPAYLDLVTARTDAEFEQAFDSLLEGVIVELESNCKQFEALDEDGLTSVLQIGLSRPGIVALRETHSNGHVDLTIEFQLGHRQRRILGEAKIYDGPAKHIKGLEQLLTRYTSGREGRGLLLAYVRKKGVSHLMESIRARMDTDLPLNQVGSTVTHDTLKWSFLSTHTHSCGDRLKVGHIACNICADKAL